MAEAYVTKALLEIELDGLRKQHQEMVRNGIAIDGAIQFCEHLLKTLTGETIIPVNEDDADN